MSNIPAIQKMYAAFAVGDLPVVLGTLSEDVEWQYGGNPDVPWLAPARGRSAVAEAFKRNASVVDIKINPKTFLESGQLVVVVLDAELTVKTNGNVIREEDAAHIWHLNSDGLVTRFRSRADTASHEKAYR